jgi:hydroxymethylbilane synthase
MPTVTPRILRLGTRSSLLARLQSQQVANDLERAHPGLKVELVLIRTSGDRILDRALHEIGGKGLFIKELEDSLLTGAIDLAVHSMKDVPVTMPLVDQSNLVIAAVTRRADPRDVLASRQRWSIAQLPAGASVGTGSLRRRAQLLSIRPDLSIQPIRGNVDTRLRRAMSGELDAVVLARAGLQRCGLYNESQMLTLEPEELLPAAAQGALALQCRRDDSHTHSLCTALNDSDSATCAHLERGVVAALNGDCHSPIGALARVQADQVQLRAAVASRGGELPIVRAGASAPLGEAQRALDAVVSSLREQGAVQLLAVKQSTDATSC